MSWLEQIAWMFPRNGLNFAPIVPNCYRHPYDTLYNAIRVLHYSMASKLKVLKELCEEHVCRRQYCKVHLVVAAVSASLLCFLSANICLERIGQTPQCKWDFYEHVVLPW